MHPLQFKLTLCVCVSACVCVCVCVCVRDDEGEYNVLVRDNMMLISSNIQLLRTIGFWLPF